MEKNCKLKYDKIKENERIVHRNFDQRLVNNTSHNLYILAIKQWRKEQNQAKIRQQKKKLSTTLNKKKPITTKDIDQLFEEKRLRPPSIKNDLINLYEQSSNRIRSMLDKTQIDIFIQTIEKRTNNLKLK